MKLDVAMSGFKLIIEKHIRLTMLLMLVLHFSCYVVHGKGELYNEMSAVDEKDNAPKKYGERLNRHTRDNLPFRSEKINLVWSKALKVRSFKVMYARVEFKVTLFVRADIGPSLIL